MSPIVLWWPKKRLAPGVRLPRPMPASLLLIQCRTSNSSIFRLPSGNSNSKTQFKRVRCVLIVVEHEMSADGGDAARKLDAQSPAGNIDLVDALITQIPVARIPIPVP